MSITESLHTINKTLEKSGTTLVAVSKTKPNELIMEAYEAGQRIFGENKVQELVDKQASLPKDIEWHMIGHLQRNKVKYLAPFVSLIHGVDTLKLLREINKEGRKNDRVIPCLLQVHIAKEDTKFGFSTEELHEILSSSVLDELEYVSIKGLMGMATNTPDEAQVKSEFEGLKSLFDEINQKYKHTQLDLKEISMGMSGDYLLAIEVGSTMVRIGSTIFGARNYPQ
ncbi:MAG: YggS family pyridoxal phosphate-dependent enzyme [Reichenbachiella sp.]|uniref:YggS family pyridoxal phosphate-dependent enzyme n=1 Tax=Reichenbachiella sp. TaxID=2184521 RepID=UPI003267A0F7